MIDLQKSQFEQNAINNRESISIKPYMVDNAKEAGLYPFPKTSKDMRTRIRYDYNHERMSIKQLSVEYDLSVTTIRKVIYSKD
jgi:hypothetical protein